MAERVPPPAPPPPPLGPSIAEGEGEGEGDGDGELPAPRGSGTYIVQVPKDQIYRVPPPENAYLAEQYRKPRSRRRGCPRCCRCAGWCLASLLLLLAASAAFFYFAVRPALPVFSVERIRAANASSSSSLPRRHARPVTRYAVAVGVRNPGVGRGVGFSFPGGGRAALSNEDAKLAAGKVPSFFHGEGRSRTVTLDLSGETARLPEGKRWKAGVTITLSMDFPARLRVGALETMVMKAHVLCSVRVSKLGRETKILHQRCQFEL